VTVTLALAFGGLLAAVLAVLAGVVRMVIGGDDE
jgi:hypothetical protein